MEITRHDTQEVHHVAAGSPRERMTDTANAAYTDSLATLTLI